MNNFTKLCDEYSYLNDNSQSEEEENSEVDRRQGTSRVSSDVVSNTDESRTDSPNNDEPPFSNYFSPPRSQPDENQDNINSQVDDADVRSVRNSQPGVLRDFLEKNANTRAIVIYYDKNNYLNKALRNRLARFIICIEKDKQMSGVKVGEFMPAFNVTKEQFLFFTNEICKTFPREHPHTYYSPYCCENGTVVQTSGKLWWHYDYTKKVLFKDGILSHRGKKENVVENNIVVPATTAAKLESLKTIQRPWDTVIQLWNDTFKARRDDLMRNKLSVRIYLDKFLCLRLKNALLLFQSDFARLHSRSVERLEKFWGTAEDHLIEKIKLLKIKEEQFGQLINLLPLSNSEQKTCIVLSLLSYLITPRRPGRKRKSLEIETEELPAQQPRLSFDERIKSFFVHIPNVVDLEVILETGINHTARYSLQHQPVPIIVGPFNNISAYYVILEDTIYEARSLLHAFQSTIEICYAVNCEYPQNARTLWIFLQQAFLNIAHASDKPSLEVTSIVGEVQEIVYRSDRENHQQ